MIFQERRLAQIVRDFMEAYELEDQVARSLEIGDLQFAAVQRLVSDSEDSALYRLKEETHALFRFDETSSKEELQAEELFDLAVGALFHEAMRFREGYYLTTTYGPRLENMMRAGVASGPLAVSFRKVFEAGRQRMHESAAESRDLFDETRDQLLIVLQHLPNSRAVARSLLEDPTRTEWVFGANLDTLLITIFGSAAKGHRLAVEGLIESGHFGTAVSWMEREDVERSGAFGAADKAFAQGMRAHYSGDPASLVHHLTTWIEAPGPYPARWRATARRALEQATSCEVLGLAQEAAELLLKLREPPPPARAPVRSVGPS